MRSTNILIALTIALTACGQRSDDTADGSDAERLAQQLPRGQPSLAARADAGAAVKSQAVDYATINGRTITGYLAYPSAAEGGLPGILVFHEWWGLNANIKSMADQLAAQGYVVLAADLYQGGVAEQADAARALMEKALREPESMAQNLRQAHAYLREQIKATRVATVGWGLGGAASLRTGLLLADQVDAVVIYYGQVGSDPGALKSLQSPVLGLFGGADVSIPVESVRAFEATLEQLSKPAEIHLYPGAAHAFANPTDGNYKPDAAADAWAKTLAFLAQHLKGG